MQQVSVDPYYHHLHDRTWPQASACAPTSECRVQLCAPASECRVQLGAPTSECRVQLCADVNACVIAQLISFARALAGLKDPNTIQERISVYRQ